MALVHYVQSLGEFSYETQDTQALEDLSEELASPGGTTSNKIPVSMAMRKLEEEFTVPMSLAFGGEAQSPEERLLRRVMVNPSRAAQVLVQSWAWHAGDQELAGFILPDIPANGFSISTATLNPSEWKMLRAELLKRFKPE